MEFYLKPYPIQPQYVDLLDEFLETLAKAYPREPVVIRRFWIRDLGVFQMKIWIKKKYFQEVREFLKAYKHKITISRLIDLGNGYMEMAGHYLIRNYHLRRGNPNRWYEVNY